MKIAVCLAVIIFAVSCNEKPTDSTNSGVSDMSSGDDFTVIKLDKTTSSIKK